MMYTQYSFYNNATSTRLIWGSMRKHTSWWGIFSAGQFVENNALIDPLRGRDGIIMIKHPRRTIEEEISIIQSQGEPRRGSIIVENKYDNPPYSAVRVYKFQKSQFHILVRTS
jgi:hypothetical protein